MSGLNIDIYLQLIGAPKPYQPAIIKRPAIHPTPTNIDASTLLTAAWLKQFAVAHPAVNWGIWNEPSHTLRGKPTAAAASDMAKIYGSFTREMGRLSPSDKFGPAGIIALAMKNTPDGGENSFLSVMFSELSSQNRNSEAGIDFVGINSYYGRLPQLIGAIDTELGIIKSKAPIVITQFAPAGLLRSKFLYARTLAQMYVNSLDNTVKSHA